MRLRPRQPSLTVLALSLIWATGAGAQDLDLPFPVLAVTTEAAHYDSYALPVGPWSGDHLPVRMVEGMILRRAWQLDAPGASLLAVTAPLREQLRAQGRTILLDCKAEDCGGFDFRFATEVMDEPAMHVDLGEFRFLSAEGKGTATGILVSRSAAAVFVQEISVTLGDPGDFPDEGRSGPPPMTPTPGLLPDPDLVLPPETEPRGATLGEGDATPLAKRLDEGFAVVLDGLDFESGSAVLAAGDHPAAAALAGWLAAGGSRRILLVGHTDISGTLEGNVALSRRRAETVRQLLIRQFGADGSRIEAVGAGPMAPRDTNATEEGRLHNRRVEAVPVTP